MKHLVKIKNPKVRLQLRDKLISKIVSDVWDNIELSNSSILLIGKTLIKMVEEDDKKYNEKD